MRGNGAFIQQALALNRAPDPENATLSYIYSLVSVDLMETLGFFESCRLICLLWSLSVPRSLDIGATFDGQEKT